MEKMGVHPRVDGEATRGCRGHQIVEVTRVLLYDEGMAIVDGGPSVSTWIERRASFDGR